MRYFTRQLPALVGTLLLCDAAQAQLAQNLLIGNAKALALGNAVTADPPGVDSIHYNPAGLTRLKGQQRMLKLIVADVSIEGEFTSTPEYDCIFDEACALATHNVPAIQQQDSARNSSSEVEKFAIYVPGMGVTELPFIVAPLGGASYQPPEGNLTFATSVYAPLILGYVRDENDPGRFYGSEMGLSRITYFSPTVGWKYSDTLQFGFGFGFSYFGAGLTLDYRAANRLVGGLAILFQDDSGEAAPGSPVDLIKSAFDNGEISPFDEVFTLEADLNEAISPTVNFGALWEPTSWLTLGLVYQSESSDRLEGDIAVNLNPDVVNFIDNIPGALAILNLDENRGQIDTTGYLNITMPQHLAVGASLQLTPKWKFNVDWKWTETSVWDEFAFYFDENLPVLAALQTVGIDGVQANALIIPRGYEDASNFAFGLEYQYNDKLALRAGYEPRKSGIPSYRQDFLIPLGDFDLYGLGAAYRMSNTETLDIALGYLNSDQKIRSGTSTNGNNTRGDNFVYNPSAGMDVRSKLEATLLEFTYHSRI